MRFARLVALLMVAVLASSQVARAQIPWHKNEHQLQSEWAAKFVPAPLRAPPRDGGGPITPVRLRFYADGDYRAGAGRWQDQVRVLLSELNKVVEPAFGVRFEGESFHKWERRSGVGAIAPMLEELERVDRGLDVDWVVGLVSPLPLISMSIHDLGHARILGRHFVLRGMASVAEMQDFNRMFGSLDRGDREKLYGRRKAHKELVVFLHEWAHALGALHVDDPTRVMGPAYSQRTSSLTREDAGVIGAGLAARLGSRGQELTDWTPLEDFVTSTRAPEWRATEREALLDILRASRTRLARATKAPRAAGAAEAAGAAGGAGNPLPLPGFRPGVHPPVPAIAKSSRPRVAGVLGTSLPPAAEPASPPAAATSAGLPRGSLGAQQRAETLARARAGATSARARQPPDSAALVSAARLFIAAGALTAGEEALDAAGSVDGEGVRQARVELLAARRRLGLPAASNGPAPRKSLVAPAAEPDYALSVEGAGRLLQSGKLRDARAAVASALQRFPGTPGLLTLDCELELRQGRARQAARRCTEALARMEDLPHAHYLLGCALAESGQPDEAITSLKRAIQLDGRDRDAWTSLGDVYRSVGRQGEYRKFLIEHGDQMGEATTR